MKKNHKPSLMINTEIYGQSLRGIISSGTQMVGESSLYDMPQYTQDGTVL